MDFADLASGQIVRFRVRRSAGGIARPPLYAADIGAARNAAALWAREFYGESVIEEQLEVAWVEVECVHGDQGGRPSVPVFCEGGHLLKFADPRCADATWLEALPQVVRTCCECGRSQAGPEPLNFHCTECGGDLEGATYLV